MRKNTVCLFLFSSLLSISGMAENRKDSTQIGRNYVIDEVVVTGTRNDTILKAAKIHHFSKLTVNTQYFLHKDTKKESDIGALHHKNNLSVIIK